ncbi:tetratricopeptide repeat protein [Persicitalea sp.]|uniref:ATP-binding protein n=1 Tax=Persicitalea sp. TaxID=3100273 RepID=UPI003593C62A
MNRLYIILLIVPLALRSFSQPSPSPKDTIYLHNLLNKGEAIETKNPKKALEYYQKGYAFAQKTKDTRGYFKSVRVLSFALNGLGRHNEAMKVAEAALKKAQEDTMSRDLATGHFSIATTALYQGDYGKAIANYQQAAKYTKAAGLLQNLSSINQNLGYLYDRQRMYDKAIEYYKKALAYDTTDKEDRRSVGVDYLSIANALDNQEKIAESRAYYKKALEYIDPKNDLDFMSTLYGNLSDQYSMEAKYDSALYYQSEALRLSREMGSPRHEQHMLMQLAIIKNRMGKYRQAVKFLDESYTIAQENTLGLNEFRNIYQQYTVAYDGLGNYLKAYEWINKYVDANDSLNNEQVKTVLQDYEVKLKKAESAQKLAEKQQEVDWLELEKERQNFWLLTAASLGFIVIGGLLFAYFYAHQRRLAADNALLAAQREGELAVAKSELDGQRKERHRISKEMHDDLGASLTAIGLLSEVAKRKMGPDTTPEIEKISSISAEMVTAMNEIIWSLNNKNDSLNGLIAYTRSYASEFIDNTDLLLRIDVEESPYELTMRGPDRRNVFLTVKEALNNAVKHADASELRLSIRPETEHLRIEVCDDGRGFVQQSVISARNGLGNMRSRMEEAGGECEFVSSSRGTCVKITYPYPTMPKTKIMQMQYSE